MFRLHLPTRFVEDSPEALLATHVEDFAELRIHSMTLLLRQRKPGLEQLVGPGFLHDGEIKTAE